METHRAKGTADQGAWQPSPTRDICARAEPILSAHHSCASSAAAAPDSQPLVGSNWAISQVMAALGGKNEAQHFEPTLGLKTCSRTLLVGQSR